MRGKVIKQRLSKLSRGCFPVENKRASVMSHLNTQDYISSLTSIALDKGRGNVIRWAYLFTNLNRQGLSRDFVDEMCTRVAI